MRRSPLPALLLALLVGCAIAGGGFLLHGTQVHNCHQIELIKTRLRTVITQGQGTLGRPGSAGYAYYRAHPDELARARADSQTALSTFAPGRC